MAWFWFVIYSICYLALGFQMYNILTYICKLKRWPLFASWYLRLAAESEYILVYHANYLFVPVILFWPLVYVTVALIIGIHILRKGKDYYAIPFHGDTDDILAQAAMNNVRGLDELRRFLALYK